MLNSIAMDCVESKNDVSVMMSIDDYLLPKTVAGSLHGSSVVSWLPLALRRIRASRQHASGGGQLKLQHSRQHGGESETSAADP